jgi:hypothetical protein
MYPDIQKITIDNKSSQIYLSRLYNWIISGQSDLNYHFLVEKIGKDYETFLGRPINRLCEYNDIKDNINSRAIHIGMIGKYDKQIPTPRFYLQLCYRIITPYMYLFNIPGGQIYLHSELSDKHKDCPGSFFKKSDLISRLKSISV